MLAETSRQLVTPRRVDIDVVVGEGDDPVVRGTPPRVARTPDSGGVTTHQSRAVSRDDVGDHVGGS